MTSRDLAFCTRKVTDFPGGSDAKASACNGGDLGSIPGLGRSPWRRKWQPTPVFLPGEFHGQRSLASYNPWGRKEADMTKLLHFHFQGDWQPGTHSLHKRVMMVSSEQSASLPVSSFSFLSLLPIPPLPFFFPLLLLLSFSIFIVCGCLVAQSCLTPFRPH